MKSSKKILGPDRWSSPGASKGIGTDGGGAPALSPNRSRADLCRATAGDYAFEPPGETHTLVVPDDVQEMATLFHVTGGYIYVDPFGVALGYEDVFTKLEHAAHHYDAVGLGKDHVRRIVR
jgi:hypothetical protein